MSKCYKTWMTVDLGYDKTELAIAKEEMRKVVDQLGYIEPEFIPAGRLLRWDTNDFLDKVTWVPLARGITDKSKYRVYMTYFLRDFRTIYMEIDGVFWSRSYTNDTQTIVELKQEGVTLYPVKMLSR